jgi:hypothetical protein
MTFGTSFMDFVDWTIIGTEIYLIHLVQKSALIPDFLTYPILLFLWVRLFYIIGWDYFFDKTIRHKDRHTVAVSPQLSNNPVE